MVSNAGGVNPHACAKAVHEISKKNGIKDLKIAVITGDNLMEKVKTSILKPTRTLYLHLKLINPVCSSFHIFNTRSLRLNKHALTPNYYLVALSYHSYVQAFQILDALNNESTGIIPIK